MRKSERSTISLLLVVPELGDGWIARCFLSSTSPPHSTTLGLAASPLRCTMTGHLDTFSSQHHALPHSPSIQQSPHHVTFDTRLAFFIRNNVTLDTRLAFFLHTQHSAFGARHSFPQNFISTLTLLVHHPSTFSLDGQNQLGVYGRHIHNGTRITPRDGMADGGMD